MQAQQSPNTSGYETFHYLAPRKSFRVHSLYKLMKQAMARITNDDQIAEPLSTKSLVREVMNLHVCLAQFSAEDFADSAFSLCDPLELRLPAPFADELPVDPNSKLDSTVASSLPIF